LEIDYQSSLIEALNVRLKHVSILISEIAKAAIPNKASSSFKASENINTKLQRRDFLSRQAQITSQWIAETPLSSTSAGVTSGARKAKQMQESTIQDYPQDHSQNACVSKREVAAYDPYASLLSQ